jgi:hypothetical protein
MDGCTLTLRGERVGDFPEAFTRQKTEERRRSLNARGARNVHRYRGDGFTHLLYEHAAAHSEGWLAVSLLFDDHGDDSATLAVLVGGGGSGPFKLEEFSMTRLLAGDEAVGAAGRFATVLRDVERTCDDLDLTVETGWTAEGDGRTALDVAHGLFDALGDPRD